MLQPVGGFAPVGARARRVGRSASAAPRGHRQVSAPVGRGCAGRPSRSSARPGRRSCGCGRCRRAGPSRRASPERRRPVRLLRPGVGPGAGRRRCALNRPYVLWSCLHVGAYRGVAGLVGGEPPGPQEVSVVVDDLDGGRQPVGIDPDDHANRGAPALLESVGTARWAVLRGGSPLLSHASSRCPTRRSPDESHVQSTGGQPIERASRRAPGPSLARHRSCVKSLGSRRQRHFGAIANALDA